MSDDVPDRDGDPEWLLASLAERTAGARSAALVSVDGLVIASHGLGADDAARLAAIASGLCSVGRAAAVHFNGQDSIRQAVIEMNGLTLFVSSAGHRSVLAVLAGENADPGVVGYEMSQLVKSVQPFLAAQPRIRGAVIRVTGTDAG
jgi:predicted regulator of Ras-like GTPase activity (Roadblock/LC7/MglB family)